MEAFLSWGFLVIGWMLSLYIAWHGGRNAEYRNWARGSLKCDQALLNSPWWSPHA